MAKQNPKLILRTAKPEETDPDEVAEMILEQPAEEVDFDEQIRQISLADGMSGGRASISRRAPGKPMWSYAGQLAVEDFSLERVRELWGGGDYRARFCDSKGKYRDHKTFVIDYNAKSDAELGKRERPMNEEALSKAIDKLSPNGPASGSQDMMLRMMEMQQKRDDQFLQLMLKSQNDAAKSQSDMMTAMITLVSAQKSNAQPQQGMDLLNALQVLDKLKGPGQNFDVIELFRLVKEMAEESGGKSESWLDKLAPFIPMLLGGQPGQLGQPGQPPMQPGGQPPIRQALPAPTGSAGTLPMPARPMSPPASVGTANGGATVSNPVPTVESPTVPAIPTTPEEMKALIVYIIRQKLPQLRAFAAQGADPYDVATLSSNPVAVPRDQFFQLCEMLEKETWIDDLFGGEAAISPFKVWFESLRKEILDEREAILQPDAEPKE